MLAREHMPRHIISCRIGLCQVCINFEELVLFGRWNLPFFRVKRVQGATPAQPQNHTGRMSSFASICKEVIAPRPAPLPPPFYLFFPAHPQGGSSRPVYFFYSMSGDCFLCSKSKIQAKWMSRVVVMLITAPFYTWQPSAASQQVVSTVRHRPAVRQGLLLVGVIDKALPTLFCHRLSAA